MLAKHQLAQCEPFMFSSCQRAADQGEGAQSSAAVRAHRGGALEAPGGAEAERGASQGCSGGEEEAAARGGEGQIFAKNLPFICVQHRRVTFPHINNYTLTKNTLKFLKFNIRVYFS